MNSTDRQIQILKNQQVLLLAIKLLVPNDVLSYVVGGEEYSRPNDWLVEVIDKCVEDTNNLMPMIGEGVA